MSESEEKKNFLRRDWEKIPEERRPWVAPLLALAVSLVVVMLWALVRSLVEPGESFGGALAAVETQTLIIVWLAMLTVGFTIWRGQQTDKQIKKSAEQIDEARAQVRQAQRQVREQGFSNAIAMATNPENEAQALAGFTRLRHLLGSSSGEAEGKEVKEYLMAAQGVALNLLAQKAVASSETGYDLPFQVRRAVFSFLIENPPEEWGSSEWEDGYGPGARRGEWRLDGYVLNNLNLSQLLQESIRKAGERERWRVSARGSHCDGLYAPGAQLSWSDFSHAYLAKAYFARADLTGADLTSANMEPSNLEGANLTHASLTSATLKGSEMERAVLTTALLAGACLQDARLKDAVLRSALLTSADLTGADLTSVDLSGAMLDRARLVRADLTGASLKNATLMGANLKITSLMRADLEKANLMNAVLAGAELMHANLEGANLTDATFRNTRIDGADFRRSEVTDPSTGAVHAVSLKTLAGCCWDKSDDANRPLLPEGIDPYRLADIPRDEESGA